MWSPRIQKTQPESDSFVKKKTMYRSAQPLPRGDKGTRERSNCSQLLRKRGKNEKKTSVPPIGSPSRVPCEKYSTVMCYVFRGISCVKDIIKAVNSYNLWTAVSYEKHLSPSDDHSDNNHRWNWKLGHIGMIFVVCVGLLFLGSPSFGEVIKVPSWTMGMKEFSKCVKPGQFKSVSSVSRTMWVKRLDLAICGKFSPIFFQALKCPSSGILKVFITWRRWNYFPFFLLSTWKCSAFLPLVQ